MNTGGVIGLGGIGGRPGKDGLSCVAFPSGIGGIPIEIIEGQCPLWFEEKQFLPDSGGEGEWRGGLAQRFIVKSREPNPFTISAATFDRIRNPAQGRNGGRPGTARNMPTSALRWTMQPCSTAP